MKIPVASVALVALTFLGGDKTLFGQTRPLFQHSPALPPSATLPGERRNEESLHAAFCSFVRQPGPSVIERFRREAPTAWQHIKEHPVRQTNVVTLTVTGKSRQTINTYKSMEGCGLVVHRSMIDHTDDSEGRAYGFTRDYAYTLEMKAGRSESNWVITRLGESNSSTDTYEVIKNQTIKHVRAGAGELFRIMGTDVLDLVQSSTFKITDCQLVSEGDRNLIQVAFDNVHPVEARPFDAVQGGTLILDPNAYWCIVRGDVKCLYSDGVVQTAITNQYELQDDGIPIPLLARTSQTGASTPETIRECRVERVHDRISKADFRLGTFGLPEPPGYDQSWNWPMWAGVAGFLLLSAGLAVRRITFKKMSR